MIDFQVCYPQNAVRLSSVAVLPGVSPRTVDVLGEDFRSIDVVEINGIESPSVVVLSPTRLLAQVPDAVLDRVTSVNVTSTQFTMTERSFLRFKVGRQATKVNGILRLVQLFVKVLFTTPGRDIWSPNFGGGALRNLGRSYGKDGGSGIVADFHIAVQTAQKQIIATQSRDPSIPREERLLSAKVTKMTFDRREGALKPTIELVNQTGKPALTSLTL